MVVGGQGAPLVPYSEYILYGSSSKNIALQNIGGIGNVTVLPKNCEINDIYAFDTGPGNMMIDEAMRQLYSKEYDLDGQIAKKGKIIVALKEELLKHPYLEIQPPKTTGREMFGKNYVDQLIAKYAKYQKEDLIYTLTWFTAYSIASSYQKFIFPKNKIDEMIIGGGGAHNSTLKTLLQDMLPDCEISTQEKYGYSSDAKEAIAFVILGNQTWNQLPSNIPSATGAKEHVILGNITFSE